MRVQSAAKAAAPFSTPRWYPLDLFERAFLLATLGSFAVRVATTLALQPINILLLISEALPVILILIRKPGAVSTHGYAWAIAIVGTFTPLLVQPRHPALLLEPLSAMLMSVGLFTNVAAKLCLNRSFGIVAGNRGVKRTGPYRFIRHPMYFGYMITHIGFLITHPSSWNIAAYAVTWTAFILRIRAEETFLLEDPEYRSYAEQVRYRLIPGLF